MLAAAGALPPRSSTAIPTWLAIQWVLATTPNVPAISGRVVNMMRLPFVASEVSGNSESGQMQRQASREGEWRTARGLKEQADAADLPWRTQCFGEICL